MPIRAGFSVREITPELPVALAGYARSERIAATVHDPLLVTALHLRSGSGTMILLSLDLLLLDPPTSRAMRAAVAKAVATTEDLIFIACTHTHSGPSTARQICQLYDPTCTEPDPDYLKQVETRAVQAAAEAAATSHSVELGWTFVRGGLEADGAIHPDAAVLALRDPNAGPFYAVGVVCDVYPAMLDENSTQVSADFPHYLRRRIKEHFGEACAVLHFTALCADRTIELDARPHTPAGAEQLGVQLADRTADALNHLEPNRFLDSPTLTGHRATVALPRRELPRQADAQQKWEACRAEHERLKSNPDSSPIRVRAAQLARAETDGTLALIQARKFGRTDEILAPYPPIEVQVMRLGEACLVGMPGMLSTHYARELMKNAAHTPCAVSMVNGDLQGYVASPDAALADRFGPMPGPFGPEAGQLLVAAAQELLKTA